MDSLETELSRARNLDVADLADAIESIGFECTRCGACCKGYETEDADETDGTDREPHTATVFPDEVRTLQSPDDVDTEYDWRDVARPLPYGLEAGDDGPKGETFEWALQTDSCGDCTFYEEADDGTGGCSVHDDRPLICQTYPFSVELSGTSQPMGEPVDRDGIVRAHECEGLGRDISRSEAETLAAALKDRAVRELSEAIGVRDNYEPIDESSRVEHGGIVVYDSEGPKTADGQPFST